jgi:hypothetical protein
MILLKQTLDPAIIAAVIGSIGAVLAAIIGGVFLLLQNIKLKKEIKFLTTGMAVAYFFSFVKPLLKRLSENNVKIIDSETKGQINITNSRLELIMPKVLDENNLSNIKKDIDALKKAEIPPTSDSDKKTFYVKYKTESSTNQTIIVIDIPNVLDAAVEYFRGSTHTTGFEISKEFQKVNDKELKNFQEQITHLVKNSGMGDKIHFNIDD